MSSSAEPVDFTVVDEHGRSAYAGRSRPWPVRPEPTSGLDVHTLDFSRIRAVGRFTVVADDASSHPFVIEDDLYAGLATDALRFFYLQRSGGPIDEARAPGYGRPAGHLGVPPNTGDTAVPAWTGPDAERLYPGWSESGRFDVSGGWYDAGDHGKYLTSGALPAWQLLATVDLLRAHPAKAPPGLEAALLEEAHWQLDWLLRMQVPPGHPYAGLAFHRVHGTAWAPPAMWPHRDPAVRVLHRPSTGAGLHLAAVAARAAQTYGEVDPAYADRLLAAARRAYSAAQVHPRAGRARRPGRLRRRTLRRRRSQRRLLLGRGRARAGSRRPSQRPLPVGRLRLRRGGRTGTPRPGLDRPRRGRPPDA